MGWHGMVRGVGMLLCFFFFCDHMAIIIVALTRDTVINYSDDVGTFIYHPVPMLLQLYSLVYVGLLVSS